MEVVAQDARGAAGGQRGRRAILVERVLGGGEQVVAAAGDPGALERQVRAHARGLVGGDAERLRQRQLAEDVAVERVAPDERVDPAARQALGGDDQLVVAGQPEPASVDKSRCEPSGKKVVELDINGDKKPDAWKFYVKVAENGAQVDALTCKEVDLNYDGHKDIWVYYDAAGNIAHEEFDLDFDGKVDMQTYRQQGKIIRQEMDTNYDGKTDVWKYFESEKLARIERSSKSNGSCS